MENNAKNSITVERTYKPVPVFMHASYCLRNIRAEGGRGSYYADLGALVLLAFAVEGFCQTYGPSAFGEEWVDVYGDDGKRVKRGVESKPVVDKLKLLARKAGLNPNFDEFPWKEIKQLLKERDNLAHPKVSTRTVDATIQVPDGEHPLDHVGSLAGQSWEKLIEHPETLNKLAQTVLDTMEAMAVGLGHDKYDVLAQGSSFYRMSAA